MIQANHMRESTIVSLCLLCFLTGCAEGGSSALASEAEEALRVIELAESLYFVESEANPALESKVSAVNNAAEAAITAYSSSNTTAAIVAQNVNKALAALQEINSAYAALPTVDAGRAAQFNQCLLLAQAAVAVSVQLASGS